MKLHKLMGQTLFRLFELGHFGIREIKVSLRNSGITLTSKIFEISLHSDCLTSVQKYWKKPACRPSGLGALKGFKAQRPCIISFSRTRALKMVLSSSERKLQLNDVTSDLQVEAKSTV